MWVNENTTRRILRAEPVELHEESLWEREPLNPSPLPLFDRILGKNNTPRTPEEQINDMIERLKEQYKDDDNDKENETERIKTALDNTPVFIQD